MEVSDDRYFANDLSKAINAEGLRRIRAAQAALKGVVAHVHLRDQYEQAQFSTLPGVTIATDLMNSIRERASAALADPIISPCAFFDGDQGEKQGIPRTAITHRVRCYTSAVAAVLPDAAKLFTESVVDAICSCIGSNFAIENVFLTRNYHVEPEISARYEMLSERWHFDHQYPDGFTLFLCVSDVTAADGPFHVVSADDSRALLRLGFDPEKRKDDPNGGLTRETIESMPSLTRCSGPSGTMLLCHTSYCLHRAGMPEPGHIRDMLMLTFRPSAIMDLGWPKK